MLNNQIKQDYSADITKFVANGGEIKTAVNTNKAEFNYCNADTVLQSAERPNSHQNAVLRKRAENRGFKSYTPVAPCRSCGTSERSVKSNLCLECDRRRFRAKIGIAENKLAQVGEYILHNNMEFAFTSDGKKYVLKVEEVA